MTASFPLMATVYEDLAVSELSFFARYMGIAP
jgi:hypothetical protein